jgi:hypothetical protein
VACRGITAGSGFATSELRLLFLDLIINIVTFWPLAQLVLYVDDLTITDHGKFGAAQRIVAQATDYAIRFFEVKLKLKVSDTKSVAIASKRAVARGVVRRMRDRRLRILTADKLLGAPYGGGGDDALLARSKNGWESSRVGRARCEAYAKLELVPASM